MKLSNESRNFRESLGGGYAANKETKKNHSMPRCSTGKSVDLLDVTSMTVETRRVTVASRLSDLTSSLPYRTTMTDSEDEKESIYE